MKVVSDYNKKYYDKRHKTPNVYDIGDYVMIKNIDVSAGVNKKLIPKFKGPYVIRKVLDADRYVISDPDGHQLTQLPYEGVCSPENMKKWISSADDPKKKPCPE